MIYIFLISLFTLFGIGGMTVPHWSKALRTLIMIRLVFSMAVVLFLNGRIYKLQPHPTRFNKLSTPAVDVSLMPNIFKRRFVACIVLLSSLAHLNVIQCTHYKVMNFCRFLICSTDFKIAGQWQY